MRGVGRSSRAAELALTGGADYEMCFTVAAAHCEEAERRLAAIGCGYRAIGLIEAAAGLRVRDRDGASVAVERGGFDVLASASCWVRPTHRIPRSP